MPWLLPVIKYRPVLGVVQVVPRRAWRPGGGSTWTTPALRRSYRQGEPPKNKISSIKVSTVRGEPRQELAAAAVRLVGEQVSRQVSTGCEEAGPVQGLRVFVELAHQLMLSTDCQGGCPVLAVAVEGPDGYTVAPALDAAAEIYDSWS